MSQTVKARFANGVLTPLEPLELDENHLVLLTIEELQSSGEEDPRSPFRVRPFPGGFAPGIDPSRMKELLCEMDDEEFFRKQDS